MYNTNPSLHPPLQTNQGYSVAQVPPARLDPHEKTRLRAAAYRATTAYPGPVGRLIQKEIYAWVDFGYRFGGTHEIFELAEHVLTVSEGVTVHVMASGQ